MLVDNHCHLFSEYYSDINKIMEEAFLAGVTKVINNGCNGSTNIEVLALAENNKSMYAALGIHPESCETYLPADLDFIEEAARQKKIIAIGEIGLDYHYSKNFKKIQRELFTKQLKIAKKYQLPIIVHSRDATEDMLKIISKYKLKGMMHSFSGSFELAQTFIKMGYLLGINGVATFKNCHLRETLKFIPLEYIVLESDCPYMSPDPYRGQKNTPANVKIVAEYLAKIYKLPVAEIARITTENASRLFDIDLTM